MNRKPPADAKPKRKRRTYVDVIAEFDLVGTLHPEAIKWKDGRIFRIDTAKEYRVAPLIELANTGRFTVVIHGEVRHLFIELMPERFPVHFGRWYVEMPD